MTTQEVANRLVELCRKGQNAEAYQELFADHAVAIEPAGAPAERTEGLAAILEKGKQFEESLEELHGSYISDPLVAENFFSVAMGMDVTMKGMGRINMNEVAVYEVNNGKIVREQFFFTPMMG